MRLTVLSIAYPLAPVGPDAVGGAEQMLFALDNALVAAGHRSIVVACSGSRVAGRLVDTGFVPEHLGDSERARALGRHRRAIGEALAHFRPDIVHSHAVDFAEHLPDVDIPTLVTLHLPREFYGATSFPSARRHVWFNCVSERQRRSFGDLPGMLPVVANGVPVDALVLRQSRRNFALCLGRICPEKGFEHAIDAARQAGTPLLIGGAVFPYEAHLSYFEREIRPRLGGRIRWLGPAGFHRKRRLLNAARCLLVPSLAAETSSLVAMEATACCTPVIAFPSGALADIVEPGVTGYLVNDSLEMAAAIHRADAIDRERCRAIARRRFSVERMVSGYLALYRRIVRSPVPV